MAKLLKLRRGTTAQHASFTGAEGEVTIDTDKDTAVVHDGSTAGGSPLAKQNMSNVPAGTILGTQLENSGVTGGQYGSSSAIPIITVDNQGLVTSASTTAIDSTKIQNGTTEVATANNGDITMKRSGTTRLVVDNAGVDVTGDISITSGRLYTDTSDYLGEVTSAGGSAESPDGSTELVNGTIGKDLSLRAFGDIVFTSSNNSTSNTVAKFQMPVLGASKHGKAILNYVTANAGGNASSSTKLETISSGISVTGNIDVTGVVDGVAIAELKTSHDSLSTSNGIILNTVTASSTHPQTENSNKLATTAYVRTAITEASPFPSGTKMLFQQTSAPTGWTKQTSGVDNKALRVVSGTAGSGGSNAFSNTLADRSITANAANTTQGGNISVANTTAGGNVNISSVSTSGTVNSHTLTINQIPSHNHNTGLQQRRGNNTNYRNNAAGLTDTGYINSGTRNYTHSGNASFNYSGGGGGHSHGFTGSSHNHNGSLSGTAHNYNASFTGSAHNHSISVSNLDLAVQYLDVIIAAKD